MKKGILAIGNALVDIIAEADLACVTETLGLEIGGMKLVNNTEAAAARAIAKSTRQDSGGSAANTAAIAAALGAPVSYIGRVANDELGKAFIADLSSCGITPSVAFDEELSAVSTGFCMSLITPDAQRTMCTYLGASFLLHEDDIHHEHVAQADTVFLEGYLLDTPRGAQIFSKVLAAAPGKVALTLSDARCVERHKSYLDAILGDVAILFGNKEEMTALFPGVETASQAVWAALSKTGQAICTDGAKGAYIGHNKDISHVWTKKVKPVDTTGAGDSYAGTVLWGINKGMDLKEAAGHAAVVSSKIVSQVGARPVGDLLEACV